jgi:hypothetical protein
MKRPLKAFIYCLRDPRDGKVRYVGKAKDPKARLREHLKSVDCPGLARWLGKLKALQRRPEIQVLEPVRQGNWERREQYWIWEMWSRGEPLTNIALGGMGIRGRVPSGETWQRYKLGLKIGLEKAKKRSRKESYINHELRRILLWRLHYRTLTGLAKDLGVEVDHLTQVLLGDREAPLDFALRVFRPEKGYSFFGVTREEVDRALESQKDTRSKTWRTI